MRNVFSLRECIMTHECSTKIEISFRGAFYSPNGYSRKYSRVNYYYFSTIFASTFFDFRCDYRLELKLGKFYPVLNYSLRRDNFALTHQPIRKRGTSFLIHVYNFALRMLKWGMPRVYAIQYNSEEVREFHGAVAVARTKSSSKNIYSRREKLSTRI